MTLTRTTWFLLVLALLVGGVVGYTFYLEKPGPQDISGKGDLAFSGARGKGNVIDQISLEGPEQKTTLIRYAQGWGIAERNNFPANESLVADLLTGFEQAAKFDPKTNESKFFERLGLVDHYITISPKVGEKSLGTLKTGDQFFSPTGEGVLTFGLDPDTGRAWTFSGLPEISDDPTFWVKKTLLTLSDLRLKSLEVKIGDEAPWRALRRDPYDTDFILENSGAGEVDQATVNKAALAAMVVRLDDVFDQENVTFFKIAEAKFKTFDGLTISMDIFDNQGVILTTMEAAFDASVLSDPETPQVLPDAPIDGDLEAQTLNQLWQGRAFQIPVTKLAEFLKFKREFLTQTQ